VDPVVDCLRRYVTIMGCRNDGRRTPISQRCVAPWIDGSEPLPPDAR
jgi:hypothetical protein